MIKKEKILPIVKKVGSNLLIIAAVVSGYIIGRNHEPTVQETNPYANTLDINDISIAVNENNELMLIERNTGKYIVYSDEVGMTVFKMYTNRIYQKAYED